MDGGGVRPMIVRGGGGHDHKTVINRVMLRFRPIAPKPANGRPDSGPPPVNNKEFLGLKRRTKRKYVRVCKNNNRGKKRKVSADHQPAERSEREDSFDKIVTLQLLPEGDDLNRSSERVGSWCNRDLTRRRENYEHQGPSNMSFELKHKQPLLDGLGAADPPPAVVESWVTVECVTDTYTCMDGGREGSGASLLGRTDLERVKNLEGDTCPGFISDGSNNVRWVNEAYKRMMRVKEWENDGVSTEVVVRLVVKENMLPWLYNCGVFTWCWVKLQYYKWNNNNNNEKSNYKKEETEKWCYQMVPCDV